MFKTLAQVIEYYNDPDQVVPNSINQAPLLAKPLWLTNGEKDDWVAFLRSLTDKRFVSKVTP